jgi:putative membrane protein
MADERALDNPSRARDHLANERTYLAWLRTAVNVMALGVVIAKFVNTGGDEAIAAGAVLVAVGAVGLFYGTLRYRRVNSELEQGRYRTGAHGRGPTIATVVLVAAIAAALALLVVGSGGNSG